MNGMSRREFIGACLATPLLWASPLSSLAAQGIDVLALKQAYSARLKKILASGALPYIDIESSCNPGKVDIDAVASAMDEYNIGLMALSADPGKNQFNKGVRYDRLSERLLAAFPDRFIPVGNGGQPPFLTEVADEFLDAQEAAAERKEIMLFGEYEFRHYPSPRQVKSGNLDRDVNVPIDGPVGQRMFGMSEKTGMAFQLHYEVEDDLLSPLEKMLEQHPKARVIWCHFAQVRYLERASRFSPAYVDGLLKRFPNLYFDTAFGDANSVYSLSNQRHARVWESQGKLNSEWKDVIVAHPTRFLSALDMGQDRINQFEKYDRNHRSFLDQLPKGAQHGVAYRNAWKLLFGEEFG